MTLVKVSALVTPEQLEFLRSDGGISPSIRRAIELLTRKRKFKLVFWRANRYGTARFNIQATDLEDLLDQATSIKEQLDSQAATVKDTFWYVYTIEEGEEAH